MSQDSITGSNIFKSSIKDKWFTANTVATKDFTRIKLNTFHSLSLVMGSEKQGFLKKRKTFATAKDDNPYSNIQDMRIYNVTEQKKHFVVGPYGGMGVTKAGPDVKAGWQIGVGVTYKLFEF